MENEELDHGTSVFTIKTDQNFNKSHHGENGKLNLKSNQNVQHDYISKSTVIWTPAVFHQQVQIII
jgi:hypothetical protein